MWDLRRIAVLVVWAVWASLLLGPDSAAVALQDSGGGEGSGTYPDTPSDAFFAEPVAQLAQRDVFAGTLCADGFCPGKAIDRKTMAVWVVRVLDGEDPLQVSASRFADVNADGFYSPFIERMAELGSQRGVATALGSAQTKA